MAFLTYSVTDNCLKIRIYCWNSHPKIWEHDSYFFPDFY